MKKYYHDKILIFSFVLSVLVIWIHSINNDSIFQDFIANKLCSFAVPGFFILSGFLLFYNLNTKEDLTHKLLKRVNTLLIPFLMWNGIYYIIYVIFKKEIHFSFNGLYTAMVSYSCNPLFWYMYQLILLSCLSIVLFFIYKNKIISYIYLVLLLFFIFLGKNLPYVNLDALFYFSLGGVFAKYNIEILSQVKDKKNTGIFIILTLLFSFVIKYCYLNIDKAFYLYNVCILSTVLCRTFACLALWSIIDYFPKNVYNFYNITFFIYATEYCIIKIVNYIFNFLTSKLAINGSIYLILSNLLFLVMPIIVIFIAYNLSVLLNKYCSFYYKILTGRR